MIFRKILAVVAVAATFAAAEGIYAGFEVGVGAQSYTIDTKSGSSGNSIEQGAPAFGMTVDLGFPVKSDPSALSVAIAFGMNGWVQSIEAYEVDDTAFLMILGPSLNVKNGRFVVGCRMGATFVIETENGYGGTMGFGLNSYFGIELVPHWSLVFDGHYTTTEYNNYADIDVSGFGIGFMYNAF